MPTYKTKRKGQKRITLNSSARTVMLRINLLSLKPIMLSSSYLAGMYKGRKKRINGLAELIKDAKVLGDISTDMQNGSAPNPETLYKRILKCVTSYVDIFYSIGSTERKKYLSMCVDDDISKGTKPHENMLMMPAFMAELDKPKERVVESIMMELYRKPLVFMLNTVDHSVRIDRYIRSMAMNGSSTGTEEHISKLLHDLRHMISRLEGSMPDPSEQSRQQEALMGIVSNLEYKSNIGILDHMAGSIMPFEHRGVRFIRK